MCSPNRTNISGSNCSQSKHQGRIGVDALLLRLQSDGYMVEEIYLSSESLRLE